MRQTPAGGACSRRENSSEAIAQKILGAIAIEKLGAGAGAVGSGSQAECSTLPDESRVAAHS